MPRSRRRAGRVGSNRHEANRTARGNAGDSASRGPPNTVSDLEAGGPEEGIDTCGDRLVTEVAESGEADDSGAARTAHARSRIRAIRSAA